MGPFRMADLGIWERDEIPQSDSEREQNMPWHLSFADRTNQDFVDLAFVSELPISHTKASGITPYGPGVWI